MTTTYNASNGRVTGTALGSTVSLGYTYGNGLLTALSRTVGGTSQSYNMTYDTFGRLLTLKVGTRSLASYSYAAQDGPLSSITYSNSQSVSYAYDNLERVTAVYYNGSSSPAVSYLYLGEGTLGQRTDHSAGQVILYTYDRLGRLLTYTGQTSGGTGIVLGEYTYDTANRLSQYSYQVSPSWSGTYTTANNYGFTYSTANGALTGMTLPGGSYAYSYDALKRLTTRTLSSGGSTVLAQNYSYLAGSGTNSTTTLVSGLTVTDGSTTLASFGYSYDNVGNITAVTGNGAATYTYDAQGQLLTETRGGVTYTYTYNGAGNLTSKTKSTGSGTDSYTYGDGQWKDLLTAYNGSTISYDGLGNPTTWYDGATMTWTCGRRLASISATSAHGAMSFVYDADGLRLKKTVGTVEHKYVWLNGQLVSEYYPGTTLEFAYDENGRPSSLLYNGTRYYYVTNLQGDVVKLVDASGASVADYVYNAWGEVVSASGTMASVNPLLYRGYYYDSELGLYYVSSRYYDPEICRFINADDASYLGANGDFISYNLFAYCLNNPVNRTDGGGNWSGWATAGLIVGAVLCIAAVTVLTCGVGTATLAGAVAVGAAKGALIGAAAGTALGAGAGYAITGTLEGAATGAAIGFGAGAVVGAAVGGSAGAHSWYGARALEFTNNPSSSEVVLGRSGTYERVATQRGSTFFHTSEARWSEVEQMCGVGKKGMWRINQAFLDQQIAAGKSFVLANNPITDGGYYFAKEVAYLAMKGVSYAVLK